MESKFSRKMASTLKPCRHAFPVASASNIITVSLQVDTSVYNPYIEIYGLQNLTCPRVLNLFPENAETAGDSMFCVNAIPSRGIFEGGTVSLNSCPGDNSNNPMLNPGDTRVFSFSCLNPASAQSPPAISILISDASSSVTTSMHVDDAEAYGVANGASVLNIVEVSFSAKSTQICPLVGVPNYIVFSFTSNVIISAGSTLTITGLTGSETNTSLSCFKLDPFPDGNRYGPNLCASWIRDSGTMSFNLQGELLSNVANEVSFLLTNPTAAQSSPTAWVNGTIVGVRNPNFPTPQDAIINRVQVQEDLVLQPFSVAGGARVLFTIVPALIDSSVFQTNMLPGASNTITIAFATNCDLPAGSQLTFSGLTSGNAKNASTLAITTSSRVLATTATWSPDVVLTVIGDGVLRGVISTIQFMVTNPETAQKSPDVQLSGYVETAIALPSPATRSAFQPSSLNKVGDEIFGVPNATFPMFVVLPFPIKQVIQTSDLIGAQNQLNFTLRSSFKFLASNSSAITITGLSGTRTASNAALPLFYPESDSSNVFGQTGNWSQEGTLILKVQTVMNAEQTYRFWILVQNPVAGQAAPNIYISASGSAGIVPAMMTTLPGMATTLNIPDFTVAQISQLTPNPGISNMISINVSIVSSLQASENYRLSIVGFTGGVGTTVSLYTGSNTQWRVSDSNIALGTLQLTLATDLTASILCRFFFYLINSRVGQASPNITIALIRGTIVLSQRQMEKATGNAQPMLIDEFTQALMYQSTASQGASVNTMTFRFRTRAALTPSGVLGQDVLVLSNMTGATTASSSSLRISDEGTGSLQLLGTSGSWTRETLRINNIAFAPSCLVLFVVSESVAFKEYVVTFNLSNPFIGQDSPSISITRYERRASSFAFIMAMAVTKGKGNIAPLLIAGFLQKNIGAANTNGAVLNFITVTLTTRTTLPQGSQISIVGFSGGIAPSGALPLVDVSHPNSSCGSLGCAALFSTSALGPPGFGLWDDGGKTLLLVLLNNSETFNYNFGFFLTNPAYGQPAPSLFINIIGDHNVSTVPMFSNGTLKVIVILTKNIGQTTPSVNRINTIHVTLALSTTFGEQLLQIAISGFTGAQANSGPLALDDASFDRSCGEFRSCNRIFSSGFGQERGYGLWDNSSKLLVLFTNASGNSSSFNFTVKFSFNITNPSIGFPFAPVLKIAVNGTTIYGSVSQINETMISAPGNSAPMLIAFYLVKNASQSTSQKNGLNMISIFMELNIDVEIGSEIGLFGLHGSSTPDSGAHYVSSSVLSNSSLWYQSNGTLRLKSSAIILPYTLYSFTFQLTNPPRGQYAPPIFLQLMFPLTSASEDVQIPVGTPMAPLFVADFLTVPTIKQLYPLAGEPNVITVVFTPNFNMTSSENSKLSVFGINVDLPETVFLLPGLAANDIEAGVEGQQIFGIHNQIGICSFTNKVLSLSIFSGKKLFNNQTCAFSLNFTNPVYEQSAPNMSISASSSLIIVDNVTMHYFNYPIFSVPNGINPFTVVIPIFLVRFMNQSSPLAGAHNNILTVQFQTNMDLSGSEIAFPGKLLPNRPISVINISGLLGAYSDESVQLLSVPGGNNANNLFSNGSTAGWGIWSNGILTQYVTKGSVFENGILYTFSFSVRNPPVAQSAPFLSVTATGTATIPLVGLTRPDTVLMGVVNGTTPLEVERPVFLNISMSQSYPVSGELNRLTVTLRLNFDMYGSDNSVITICCITGASSPSYVKLMPSANGDGSDVLFANGTETGWASWNNGTLKLSVGIDSVLMYQHLYVFSFIVRNPPLAQSAPYLSIEASGTAIVTLRSVDRPNTMLMGVRNGSNPLEVIVPFFYNKSMKQSYPFSDEHNILTVGISLNFDLDGRDNSAITISGITGAIAPPSIQLLPEPGGNGGDLLFSNGTSAGHGAWNNGTLTLHVNPDSIVVHEILYTFSFIVKNPSVAQSAPYISIEASGTAHIPRIAVVVPDKMLMGVRNGSNPLEVIVPFFYNKSMKQSYPFSDEHNILTVGISLNFDLDGRDNSAITISGITGAIAPPSIQLLPEPGGNGGDLLFSNGTSAGHGAWNNGTLTLHVNPDSIVVHEILYTFSFIVKNPSVAQSAPYISIKASGTVSTKLVGATRHDLENFGIPNGSNPLNIVTPRFLIQTMNQSMPTVSAHRNVLTLKIQLNFDMLGSRFLFRNEYLPSRNQSSVTIFGLSGGKADGSVQLLSVSGGNGAEDLFSNGSTRRWALWSNGTVTLHVANASVIKNGIIYTLSFAVQNPSVAQSAPFVSVTASGTATIPLVDLTRPNTDLLGVINGYNPLEIIVPTFLNATMAQTTPLISAWNVLSVLLRTNINLAGSDGSAVTLNGLVGAIFDTAVSITVEAEINKQYIFDFEANGTWSNNSVVLNVERAVTLVSYTMYRVSFSIQNPKMVQDAPSVRMQGSGTATFLETELMYTNETRFGVAFGANPLYIIEVLWLEREIAQSTPVSSINNTISATLVSNCDLTFGTAISLSGLVGSNTKDSDIDVKSTPSGFIDRAARWRQENGTLVMFVVNISANSRYELHFVLKNRDLDQNASAINISGEVNISRHSSPIRPVFMYSSKEALVGVFNGASPLLTRVPRFYFAIIFQSNPASFIKNKITVQFRVNINLNWTDNSNITIGGFSGMVIPDDVIQLLPIPGGNGGDQLFGTAQISQGHVPFQFNTTIVLPLFPGQTVLSETDYSFCFVILNPKSPQNAQPLTISADGTALFKPSLVQFFNQPRYGLPNGTNPLLVVETVFLKAAIAQSKPLAAYVNTITVTIKMSLNLDQGSLFIISGFSPDAYPIRNPSMSPYKPLDLSNAYLDFKFMPVDGGNGGENLFRGFFDNGTITLVVLENTTIFRMVEYRFSFQILNPNRAQGAPSISIEAHGVNETSNFPLTKLEVPNRQLLGIVNGTNVLKLVFEPLFSRIFMYQSTPLADCPNVLTVEFRITFEMLGSDSSVITISGFSPTSIVRNPVKLSSPGSNINTSASVIFSYNGSRGFAEWDEVYGMLYLHVDPLSQVKANVDYIFRFHVMNPSYEQYAPSVSIQATGTAEFYLRRVDFVNYTIFGVVNGSLPLFTVIPRFEIAYMEQDNSTIDSQNYLTFFFRVNVELSHNNSGSITISGLSGTREPSKSLPIIDSMTASFLGYPVNEAASKFQVDDSSYENGQALWDSSYSNGSLILKLGASENHSKEEKVINSKTTYGIRVAIRNGLKGQISPLIQIEAFGGQNLHFRVANITKGVGNLAPLLIAEFVSKFIRQSTPLQGVKNIIYIKISNYATLQGSINSSGTSITIAGLIGSNTSHQDLVLSGDVDALNCSGSWNQLAGNLIIRCAGDLVALRLYYLSFELTNPNVKQESPTVLISCSGAVIVQPVIMEKGVKNERPLLVAGFLSASIRQSTPSAHAENILQINFSTSLEMKVSDNVQITVHGLRGTDTLAFRIGIFDGPFGSAAAWNFLSGVAILNLLNDTLPGANVSVSLVVFNPGEPRDPASPILTGFGLGSIELAYHDDNTAPLRTAGVVRSFMNQSTHYQNSSNILSISLSFSCDLTKGTYLILTGLNGISTVSGEILVTSEPTGIAESALWSSDETLIKIAIMNQTMKYTNYSFSFAVTNQGAGQVSPDISISSTGIIVTNPVSVTKAVGRFEPLLILGFRVKSVGQSTSIAYEYNTITISLSTNAPLYPDSKITISGLQSGDKSPRCTVTGVSPNFTSYFDYFSSCLQDGMLVLPISNETVPNNLYIFDLNVTNPGHQISPIIISSIMSGSSIAITPTVMDKSSGASAPFLVTLPAQLLPECSNLSDWRLVSSNLSFKPREGFGIAFNGGLVLAGTTAFGSTAQWFKATGTLVLQVIDDILAGHRHVISFSLQNPAHQLDASSSIVINATGSATVGAQGMQTSQEKLEFPSSSPGDRIPFKVYGPAWALKQIWQSSAYPNAKNNITVLFSTFADLAASGGCSVTITGLSGTVTDSTSELQVFYLDSDAEADAVFGHHGAWDQSGNLSLQIAAGRTLHAGRTYTVLFQLTNPGTSRNAVSVSIGASGTPSINFSVMDSRSGESAPLLVLASGFSVRQIGQSTPWPGAQNKISVTLAVTEHLASPFTVIISNISGVMADNSSQEIPAISSPTFFASAGYFSSRDGVMNISLRDNTVWPAAVTVVASFTFQNQLLANEPPDVLISGQGISMNFPPTYMHQDSQELLTVRGAIPGDARPFKVYGPDLFVRTVAQSSPIPGARNVISVTLCSNWPIPSNEYRGFQILGFEAALSVSIVFAVSLNIMGNIHTRNKSLIFSSDTVYLEIFEADNETIDPGSMIRIWISVVNPLKETNSVDMFVSAIASNQSNTTFLTTFVKMDKENSAPNVSGAVPGDAMPFKVYGPAWALKQIWQSSAYPNAKNNITVLFSTFADLAASGGCSVTITGLSGTVTDSTSELRVFYLDSDAEADAVFGHHGAWDQSGTLSLQIAAGRTLHAGRTYTVLFQLTNPGTSRNAVSVSIGASGTPSINFSVMDSRSGESAPLLVLASGFSVRQIGQSTPWPGIVNEISCTVAATSALPMGALVLISGLIGSATGDSGAHLVESSSATLHSSGVWNQKHGSLAVALSRNMSQGEALVFSFLLTNPVVGQDAPAPITVAVSPPDVPAPVDTSFSVAGHWLVLPHAMDPDTTAPPSVPGAVQGDATPMRVYSPGFAIAAIGQAAPFPGAINLITVTVVSNFNLTAARGSRVTVSGLHGSATPDSELLYLAGGFDGKRFFNDIHVSPDGQAWSQLAASAAWSAREGHALVAQNQTLYVIAGTTVNSQGKQSYLSDVWASPDGLAWSLVASAQFGPRAYFGAVALGPMPHQGLLVFGGATYSSVRQQRRLNDVWRSNDGGRTWFLLVNSTMWAARYGLATTLHLAPVLPPDGRHTLYSDSATTPSVLLTSGSTCSEGCNFYDPTLPGCAVLAGIMPQCCTSSDPCMQHYSLADLWASTDGGLTWAEVAAPVPYAPRAFPVLAGLPDGSIAVATGYDYWDHFTPDMQVLLSTGSGLHWQKVATNAAGADGLRRAGGRMVVVKGCLLMLGGQSRREANMYTYYGDVWTTG